MFLRRIKSFQFQNLVLYEEISRGFKFCMAGVVYIFYILNANIKISSSVRPNTWKRQYILQVSYAYVLRQCMYL